jgi:hypothetical protein
MICTRVPACSKTLPSDGVILGERILDRTIENGRASATKSPAMPSAESSRRDTLSGSVRRAELDAAMSSETRMRPGAYPAR